MNDQKSAAQAAAAVMVQDRSWSKIRVSFDMRLLSYIMKNSAVHCVIVVLCILLSRLIATVCREPAFPADAGSTAIS